MGPQIAGPFFILKGGVDMTTFVDRVTLHATAGNGGDGCVSVHREKFKPLGGPDGDIQQGSQSLFLPLGFFVEQIDQSESPY